MSRTLVGTQLQDGSSRATRAGAPGPLDASAVPVHPRDSGPFVHLALPMNAIQAKFLTAVLALGGCAVPTDYRASPMRSASPPNAVRHSPRLITSGQPPARWFASDDAAHLQVIVHLWASEAAELAFNEAQIVGHQRKLYVFQTIEFAQPIDDDLVTFLRVMNSLQGRNVQVHCQLNVLASSMVFLYQVIEEKRDAYAAYEDVVRVWSPNAVWQSYFRSSLARRGIAFEPD